MMQVVTLIGTPSIPKSKKVLAGCRSSCWVHWFNYIPFLIQFSWGFISIQWLEKKTKPMRILVWRVYPRSPSPMDMSILSHDWGPYHTQCGSSPSVSRQVVACIPSVLCRKSVTYVVKANGTDSSYFAPIFVQ